MRLSSTPSPLASLRLLVLARAVLPAAALGVLLLAASPAVVQAKDAVQAEHERLSDEIEKLASRQVWAGVERKFSELEKLEAVEPTFEDLLHGAHAARELGDVAAAYERLKKAAKLQGSKEVVDWLWDIDQNYGFVELVSVPPRSAVLSAELMPFDPNARKAVDAAIESARQDGIFVGMLPKGSYEFAAQPFRVEPGVNVRIEVSPRMRRQGLIDPVYVYPETPGSMVNDTTPETPPTSEEEEK